MKQTLLVAAVSGLMLGTALNAAAGEDENKDKSAKSAKEKHACKGQNACKGQGGCKSSDKHACKGQNACKGQGGCKG